MTALHESSAVVVLEVDKSPLGPNGPQKWNATFLGEPLLLRSRDPEHDACRALLARGITGKVTFVHKVTGMAGLTMGIAWGAERTTRETTRDGRPRTAKWQPFSSRRPLPDHPPTIGMVAARRKELRP